MTEATMEVADEVVEAESKSTAVAPLDPIQRIEAGLATLKAQAKSFDLSTTAGAKEARAFRALCVKTRTALDDAYEQVNRPLLNLQRDARDLKKRITDEILAMENPVADQIKADEARREADRQARAQVEQARLDGIQKRIRAFGSFAIRAMGEPSATIADLVRELVALEPTQPVFEEFLPTAQQAHADALAGLRVLHDKTVAQEVESQRLADERAELDRQRAADEATRAERDRQEATARAEREADEQRQRQVEENERSRVAEIRERIAGFGRAVDMMAGSSAQDLMSAANAMPPPHADEFAEFLDDATAAFCAAVQRLETMYQAAFDQEQQAAANARKAAELAEQQAALDKQRAEQEAAEQARKDAAAAEQRRIDDERREQLAREGWERAEKERIEREQREAAEAEAHAARERLHQAAAQLVDALEDVKADGGFPMLSMDTQEKVDAAIAAAG